ncbi:hypothetical protein HOY80DRAFT_942419 [Tuber brumale]|nr:hypothetical protein HOY80DRAFT_942419 [Tuber brumale]
MNEWMNGTDETRLLGRYDAGCAPWAIITLPPLSPFFYAPTTLFTFPFSSFFFIYTFGPGFLAWSFHIIRLSFLSFVARRRYR